MRPRIALTTAVRVEITQLRLSLQCDEPMQGKRLFGSRNIKNIEPLPAFQLKRVWSVIPSTMKEKSDDQCGFFEPRFLIGLLVLLASALLVGFGSGAFARAITQQRRTKSAPNVAQAPNVKPSNQQPNQGFWAQTNGPQGGDGITLATNPSGHVFVGTQGGGVFRSTDNGGTWTGVSNGMTDTNVRALAINSVDHIFAGTFSGVFQF